MDFLKKLIKELKSRKLEVIIVDSLLEWAGDASKWFITACVLAFLAFAGFLIKHILSIKVLLLVVTYLISNPAWWSGIFCAIIGFLIYTYNNFTDRGRRTHVLRLLRLIRQYEKFDHDKEMEIVSQIHSRTETAVLVFLMTCFLTLPLVIVICYFFGVAIISDITNNIKGTHIQLSVGPKLFFNSYGVALGLAFIWIFSLLESARSESLFLSAKYRHKMITDWQARVDKIESKLP